MCDRLEDLKLMANGWKSGGVRSLAVDIMEWALAEIERLRSEIKTLQNVRVIKGDDIGTDKSYGVFPEGYDHSG